MKRMIREAASRFRTSIVEVSKQWASIWVVISVALLPLCLGHPRPAIAAGVDQRGYVRLGTGCANCSVGASEYDSPGPPPNCVGDCTGDGAVTVDELITMVNIVLGSANVSGCEAGDANDDGAINVAEIITAVNVALLGCSMLPTPTATPQPTPTPTPNCEITVSGEVYDATVGPTHGISGARVSVQLSAPRSFEAITGADGRYTLSVPSPYGCLVQRLDVEASGYAAASIPVTAADLLAHPVRDFALGPVSSARHR